MAHVVDSHNRTVLAHRADAAAARKLTQQQSRAAALAADEEKRQQLETEISRFKSTGDAWKTIRAISLKYGEFVADFAASKTIVAEVEAALESGGGRVYAAACEYAAKNQAGDINHNTQRRAQQMLAKLKDREPLIEDMKVRSITVRPNLSSRNSAQHSAATPPARSCSRVAPLPTASG